MGYDRWAAKYNLKQMAATVTAYQQYGFSSPEELDEACSAMPIHAMQESLTELKPRWKRRWTGKRSCNGRCLPIQDPPCPGRAETAEKRQSKSSLPTEARKRLYHSRRSRPIFRENGISKLPSYKALQAEIENLIEEKNSGYNDYRAKRRNTAAYRPSRAIFTRFYARERKPVKKQEQER